MPNIIELGLKIRAAREEKAFSQEKVVERLKQYGINMSRETLSKIENGNRSISAVELNSLCNILGIDINSLLNDDGDDLVTLFRKKCFSESTIDEVERLQDMIKLFIYQKKIYYGEFKHIKRKPLWEEC